MFKVTAAAALAAAALVGSAAATGPVQSGCHRGAKRSVRSESAGDAFGTVATHSSGLIRIGVNREGNLNWEPRAGFNTQNSVSNIFPYGLRYVDADPGHILNAGAPGAEYESTAPGCLCEGWGAGAWDTSGTFLSGGSANEDDGYPGLSNISNLVVTPSNDAAAQNVTASAQAGECLRVEHRYYPSTSRYLYEVDVTLTNICAFGLGQVKYVRVMDWDMEPTAFNERVELNPGDALDLECLHDNGFEFADPQVTSTVGILQSSCAPANTNTLLNVADNGAYFRFNFHDVNSTAPLAPGASKTLKTFYGAAPTRSLAAAALMSVDAEAYSFGHSISTDAGFGVNGYTSIFAFAGVGGSVVEIPDDSFTAPCGSCSSVHVESDGNSVTLNFAENGPYTATCL